MKHAGPLLFLLFLLPLAAKTQDDCYKLLYQIGQEAFNAGRYGDAIKKWNAAKGCPDKPANNDLDRRIEQARAKISAPSKPKKTATAGSKTDKKGQTASSKKPASNSKKKASASDLNAEAERKRKEADQLAEAERQRQAAAEAERKKQEEADRYKKKGKSGSPFGKPGSQSLPGDAVEKPKSESAAAWVSQSVSGAVDGRKLVYRPSMESDMQKTGKVAVRVCVDSSGNVTSAQYTQLGSTTTDSELRYKAESWARRFRFAPSGVSEECGTISFSFVSKP